MIKFRFDECEVRHLKHELVTLKGSLALKINDRIIFMIHDDGHIRCATAYPKGIKMKKFAKLITETNDENSPNYVVYLMADEAEKSKDKCKWCGYRE